MWADARQQVQLQQGCWDSEGQQQELRSNSSSICSSSGNLSTELFEVASPGVVAHRLQRPPSRQTTGRDLVCINALFMDPQEEQEQGITSAASTQYFPLSRAASQLPRGASNAAAAAWAAGDEATPAGLPTQLSKQLSEEFQALKAQLMHGITAASAAGEEQGSAEAGEGSREQLLSALQALRQLLGGQAGPGSSAVLASLLQGGQGQGFASAAGAAGAARDGEIQSDQQVADVKHDGSAADDACRATSQQPTEASAAPQQKQA
jgi:hypothetical protein